MAISLSVHMRRVRDDDTGHVNIDNERQAVKTTLIIICTCLVLNLPTVITFISGSLGAFNQVF